METGKLSRDFYRLDEKIQIALSMSLDQETLFRFSSVLAYLNSEEAVEIIESSSNMTELIIKLGDKIPEMARKNCEMTDKLMKAQGKVSNSDLEEIARPNLSKEQIKERAKEKPLRGLEAIVFALVCSFPESNRESFVKNLQKFIQQNPSNLQYLDSLLLLSKLKQETSYIDDI